MGIFCSGNKKLGNTRKLYKVMYYTMRTSYTYTTFMVLPNQGIYM